ncbi:nucleoside-diphosphate-sugar epimerase [Leifsonia xyli subsp. cynodontis DSM 46306]|uniref:Uncharacterized protein n=1 Tax=Leifsonia xyli subsp. cynodontis DSM 46306 TaxID=1389489 RepID=U3P8V7_LEIXC|nr:hypothetical protein [Leifsonia xyli]AGW41748.1 nucleoside-diphosphate-sugar epimerase [Leifsonia xyli subsp. cynodontis DSM 46306]AGW42271.1 nucleoside-diphosphate-sugar epimerase [Leifsonia xyli subsp. cynodontis DSM 46306]
MTDDYSAALLRALQGRARVKILQGTFVAQSTFGCNVDVGVGSSSSRIPAHLGTSFLPEVNEPVWVWNIDKQWFVTGPVASKPDRGTVVSVASGLVTLTTALGTTVIAPYTGPSPSAGQIMKLLWHGGPFAMLMSTSPVPNTPPPAPGGGTTTHQDVFTAIDAGSYGSGRWWTNQVYASDKNLGCWFYGTKTADTIPASATIQRVELYVSPERISGSPPNIAVHGYSAKPGDAPALATVAAVAISGGWVTLPASIGNNLKAGGGYVGVGFNHGGYSILRSLAEDGFSGALRITSTY